MSNFYIDIVDRPIFYLTVNTEVGTNIDNLEIIKYNDYNLEIVNTDRVLASDLPDDIPMSKIIGNLHVTRIDGLEEYLADFASVSVENIIGLDDYLDLYNFDCGSP